MGHAAHYVVLVSEAFPLMVLCVLRHRAAGATVISPVFCPVLFLLWLSGFLPQRPLSSHTPLSGYWAWSLASVSTVGLR